MMRAALATGAGALLTLAVIATVMLAILVPVALSQPDPSEVLRLFLLGPFDSLRHAGNILELATPILLTGLAATVIFRSGLFNLGVEGSFFLGGLGAAAMALLVPLPAPVAAPVALLAGACTGSLACALPGWLRLRFGASEMVNALVLNYALLFAGIFVLNHLLRDPAAGALASYRIPEAAGLERLLAGTRLNSGVFIALAACLAAGVWLFHTRAGLNLRIAGASPGFAAHLGLPSHRIILQAQIAGGLIAGLAGAVEVLGLYTRFTWTALPGQGWTGIIVAILARENPFLLIPAALFLAYLQVGGDILARSLDVPGEIVGLVTAAILLSVTATAIFRNPRLMALLRRLRHGAAA